MKITGGFILLAIMFLSQISLAQYVSDGKEIAFDGYDITSYFDDKPVKGHRMINFEYQDLNLAFSSVENRQKFIDNPEKYLPAYGGWCATAVVNGTLIEPNFSLYKVQEGKLLFFEVKAFFNGQTQWEKDPDYHKLLADAQFSSLHAAKTEKSKTKK
ncbi:MAG: YHS domain-containing (seleno)protein [Bacteroidota bacterium]